MHLEKKLSGFTLLKLIAVIQVVYIHFVTHLNLHQFPVPIPLDLYRILSPFEGVPIFFSLSGFFIWKSLSHHPVSFRSYARRRATRIFPELWIVTGCTAGAILLFCHREMEAIPFLGWIAAQASFLQFWTPSCLSGFGIGCPNGSLWTITIFLQFYLVVFFLHRLLHGRKIGVWIPAMLISAVLNCVPSYFESSIPSILMKLYQQSIFPYLSVFLFAAMTAEYEDALQPILKYKLTIPALYILLYVGIPFDFQGVGYSLFRPMFICLLAVSFGSCIRCPILKEDISYEIYLVHMPIVNILLEFTAVPNWNTFLIAAGASLLLASCLFRLNRRIIRQMDSRH